MGSGLGLGIIGFVLRLVGFCVGFGGFSGWVRSGWGGLRFRLKYQEFLQQLFWLNFRYWVFFQVGLGFDSGFGFQIFVFCFSLGFKAGLRGLIGVFDTAD